MLNIEYLKNLINKCLFSFVYLIIIKIKSSGEILFGVELEVD